MMNRSLGRTGYHSHHRHSLSKFIAFLYLITPLLLKKWLLSSITQLSSPNTTLSRFRNSSPHTTPIRSPFSVSSVEEWNAPQPKMTVFSAFNSVRDTTHSRLLAK